jgi:cysteinyl-tRNA synthetase
MKLYNSLSRTVEEFKPLNPLRITMYSCGPTVYDRAHLGNLTSFIYADTLRRSLTIEFPSAKFDYVMNVTDVDDKTILRSHKEYPMLDTTAALKKLTLKYEQLFMNDLSAVGIDTNSIIFMRATESENILAMQQLIIELLDAGVAYPSDDGIYFSIEQYVKRHKRYGQLVEITSANTSQNRISNDEYDKDNIHDFVLWKKQKDGEPAWEFNISGQSYKGRPGWHIECSAMSTKQLGQPFDIHTGGVDLKFPHHENEIAQSTASIEQDRLAQVFVHSEHMLVENQKMSKSDNNFYTLDDLIHKGYDPLSFRVLVLQSHYRNQLHFSWENLEAAQNRLKAIKNFFCLKFQSTISTDYEEKSKDILLDKNRIYEAMRSDLNSPRAIKELSDAIDQLIASGVIPSTPVLDKFAIELDAIFGLNLAAVEDISDQQKALISQREDARKIEDWHRSDELREKLQADGIGVNDTSSGPIWFRF